MQHNVLCADLLAVNSFVGVVVWAQRGPSSEIPANKPREREYVSTSARIVTSVAASASRPTGPAAAEASAPSFTLLFEDGACTAPFITSRTKSVACRAELKSEASAFERHHRRRAPGTREVVAAAARHGAPAIAAANYDGRLDYRRHDNHAIRFVEQILRNIVRNIDNLLHHLAGVLDAVLFLACVVRGGSGAGLIEESRPTSDAMRQTDRLFSSLPPLDGRASLNPGPV